MIRTRQRAGAWVLLLHLALQGCAGSAGDRETMYAADPFETANRAMYRLNERLDELLVGPLSHTYGYLVPPAARARAGRFFDNLGYPHTILNGLLQGRFDQGLSDTARFVFNTTIGIGGLFDVAGPAGLPKHEADLGQTLAAWGLPQGPYLFLPLLGPATLRSLPDVPLRIYTDPLHYGGLSTAARLSLGGTKAIDRRYNLEDEIRAVRELALDRYAFTRSAFLQHRQAERFDGLPPLGEELEQWLEEEEEEDEGSGYLQIE